MPHGLLSACLLCAALAYPTRAGADGFMFQAVGATGEVRAEAQRAVLWLHDGQWELSIYPIFAREAGSSAWVVPFPVRPTVTEGSADLFDELEVITAPVTVEFCWDPHCCCEGDEWCYGADAGVAGGEGDADWVEPTVTVWERGTVGALDYVVLSSADGDSLATWLADNGYALPAGAEPILDTLVTEGSFFFASKLQADVDPDDPIAPVTFALPDLEDPGYPLRLTAAGVAEGAELDLILWVVTPKDQIHSVANDFEPDIDYHGVLAFHPFVVNPMSCVDFEDYDYYVFGYCVDFEAFGYELPEDFSAPLQEIIDEGYAVTRYSIGLDADAMAEDMRFEPNQRPELEIHDEQWDMISNINGVETGPCYSCPPCPEPPDPGPDADPDAGDGSPDSAEPSPDAEGGLPDVISGPDAGIVGRADASGQAGSTVSGKDDDGGACSVVPHKAPARLVGILLLAGLLLAFGCRRW